MDPSLQVFFLCRNFPTKKKTIFLIEDLFFRYKNFKETNHLQNIKLLVLIANTLHQILSLWKWYFFLRSGILMGFETLHCFAINQQELSLSFSHNLIQKNSLLLILYNLVRMEELQVGKDLYHLWVYSYSLVVNDFTHILLIYIFPKPS